MAYNCGQHSLRSASFLLILFYLQFCFSADTIAFNKPIQDPERLVSNNGNFILGFFSPDKTTNRYLGILLNDSSNEAVWVANRDTPLNDFSGIVKIHEDGNLVVLNGLDEILWSTNVSNAAANSSAQLLDNGNIVLLDSSNRRNIWESFKHPVHSFMKYMRLGSNRNTKVKDLLTSWTSPSNPSPGLFTAGLDYSIPPQIFIWNSSQPHWRSGPWNGQFFIGVPNMDGNYAYPHSFGIEEDKDGTVYITLRSAQDAYIPYYVLNYEGKLLAKVFLVRKKNWEVSWTSQESECSRYGKCGPFGICNPVDSPICWCVRGFEPRDIVEWNRGNWTGGCTRRTRLQCQSNNSVGQESKRDGFLKLDTMKVPDFAQQISVDTEMECVRRCSSDCSCIAYAYDGGIRCMHWNVSLTDLHKFSSGGASLYVRLADSELDKKEDEMSGLSKRRKQKQMTVTATTVIIGSLTITLFSYFVWWRINKQKGRKQKKGYGDNKDQVDLQELPLFEFQEIANATDNFNCVNKLGEGGFGPVFRGKMPNGKEIAVKRLSTFSSQGMEEFMNEVVVISKLQHRNLVRLLGCSVERGEKMLVYEYMPNKSLDTLLFGSDNEVVHWSRRAKIIEGIGRGLLYLHRDSRLRIIHRDLKLGNILLDEELNPKISDFGMARIFGANQHQANTRRVVGTYGYMAPEYAMQGKFSEKSDVYSFGILVLEITSGRKNSSFYQQDMSLVSFVWKMWNENSIVELLDPTISDPQFRDEILRHVHVGLLCVQEFPKDRPTISTVLSMLSSEIMDLPTPKQPAFTIRQNSSKTESSKKSDACLSNNITLTTIEGR